MRLTTEERTRRYNFTLSLGRFSFIIVGRSILDCQGALISNVTISNLIGVHIGLLVSVTPVSW